MSDKRGVASNRAPSASQEVTDQHFGQTEAQTIGRQLARIKELEDELAAYDADFLFEARVARINESVAAGLNAALNLAIEDIAALTRIPAASLAVRYRAKQQQGFFEHSAAAWSPGVELTVGETLEQIAQTDGPTIKAAQQFLDRIGEQRIQASADELEAINGLNRVLHKELVAQVCGEAPGACMHGLGTAAYDAVHAVKSTRLTDVIPWAKPVLEAIKQAR